MSHNPLALWKGLQGRLAEWWQRRRGALAWWRRAPPRAGPWPALPAPLERCATVVIPALNEAARIGDVVRHVLADSATAEVIVIDDSSIDDTARLAREAGAEVITSTMLGKGASMRDGAGFARHDIVVYVDGDLAGLREGLVTALARPIARGEADFVKARFGRSGGRVTELTARPMLQVFFPELARFAQPLGGLIAARRELLKTLPFEDGYGVDIGLLIDAQRAGARLREVDIGTLENDSQPLADLAAMANEVSRVIFSRARAAGRLHVEQIGAMYETQRLATATLDYALTRRRGAVPLHAPPAVRTRGRCAAPGAARGGVGQRDAPRRLLGGPRHRELVRRGRHPAPARLRRLRARAHAGLRRRRVQRRAAPQCRVPAPRGPGAGLALCRSHALARLREDTQTPAVETIWAVADGLDDIEWLRAVDHAYAIGPLARRLEVDAGAKAVASFADLMAVVPAAAAAAPADATMRSTAIES